MPSQLVGEQTQVPLSWHWLWNDRAQGGLAKLPTWKKVAALVHLKCGPGALEWLTHLGNLSNHWLNREPNPLPQAPEQFNRISVKWCDKARQAKARVLCANATSKCKYRDKSYYGEKLDHQSTDWTIQMAFMVPQNEKLLLARVTKPSNEKNWNTWHQAAIKRNQVLKLGAKVIPSNKWRASLSD